jgi:hypothetical protein
MESESSCPCSQEPATGLCVEPDDSGPHRPSNFFKIHFNIIIPPVPMSYKNYSFYRLSNTVYAFLICCVYFKLVAGLRIRIANLVFKLLTCLLYIIRVISDLDPTYSTWWVTLTTMLFQQRSADRCDVLWIAVYTLTFCSIHVNGQ